MNDDEHNDNGYQGSGGFMFRPPPLRTTSNTYDDEEAFTNVAINLLSRYEALGLSANEAIMATIVDPRERISFHEALCIRKCRSVHVSPSSAVLVGHVDKAFGGELMKIIKLESGNMKILSLDKHLDHGECPPTTPRAIHISSSSGSDSHHEVVEKKTRRRRFFPDTDSKGGGFFRSRKVQNIDWSMAEAVSQVQSLRLDGSCTPKEGNVGVYEPPTPIANMAM
jgi:hypothetical protein